MIGVTCSGPSDSVTVDEVEFRETLSGAVRLARGFNDGLSECGLVCDMGILALNPEQDDMYAQLTQPNSQERLEKAATPSTVFPCGKLKETAAAKSARMKPQKEMNQARTMPKEPEKIEEVPGKVEEEPNICQDGIVALTYATHGGRDDRFCRAIESALQHRVPLRILGWGEAWSGLTQKLEGTLKALRSLDDECIVVFTDAYDVLYSSGLEEIKAKFLEMSSPVLFAGECGCWPQIQRDRGQPDWGSVCLNDYPASPTPYRYLNSGQWIAQKKNALEIMETLMSEAHVYAKKYDVPVSKINDQEMVSDMYMNSRFNIELDHTNKIFAPMHATHDKPLAECDPYPEMVNQAGVWKNKVYGTSPSIFHFNGGGKKHHLKMEKQMWYKSGQHASSMTRDALMSELLRVGDGDGTLVEFKELCPTYK
jgi:hypothetical protein